MATGQASWPRTRASSAAPVCWAGWRGAHRRGGRFGGGLSFLLPEIDAATVRMPAEQVEARIAALAIPHAGSVVADRVTVSIGVGATVSSADAVTRAFVALVDRLLDTAKHAGCNRILQVGCGDCR